MLHGGMLHGGMLLMKSVTQSLVWASPPGTNLAGLVHSIYIAELIVISSSHHSYTTVAYSIRLQ